MWSFSATPTGSLSQKKGRGTRQGFPVCLITGVCSPARRLNYPLAPASRPHSHSQPMSRLLQLSCPWRLMEKIHWPRKGGLRLRVRQGPCLCAQGRFWGVCVLRACRRGFSSRAPQASHLQYSLAFGIISRAPVPGPDCRRQRQGRCGI